MSMIMEGIRVVEFANFIAAPSCRQEPGRLGR